MLKSEAPGKDSQTWQARAALVALLEMMWLGVKAVLVSHFGW